jgi:hypothetical protein
MGFFGKLFELWRDDYVHDEPTPDKPAVGTALTLTNEEPRKQLAAYVPANLRKKISRRQIATNKQSGDIQDAMGQEQTIQPREWQEAKSQVFSIAARLGIIVGQTARGTKTLSCNGQVREFDSWLGAWTALTSGR